MWSHLPEEYVGASRLHTGAQSIYGEGKRASELMCALHAKQHGHRMRHRALLGILRAASAAFDAHFAIGNFIRDVMAGGPDTHRW